MKKIEIRENTRMFSPSELDGHYISTPEDAWNVLVGSVEKKYKSFYIDYDYNYYEHGSGTFILYGIRDETDEEFEIRCKKESENAAEMLLWKMAEERALLEKLKKKYE